MTVSDHVLSFGTGAAVAGAAVVVVMGVAGAGASDVSGVATVAVAVGLVGMGAGVAAPDTFAGGDITLKPPSAIAGFLTSAAAIAFAAYQFGVQTPEPPTAPEAAAPVTTLIAKGNCEGIRTDPPGCTLTLAP